MHYESMRIVSNYQYQYKPANNIKFCGLLHIDKNNGNIIDSWFYRDCDVLEKSVQIITEKFPQGGDILDYASSTGEEQISIKSLLPNNKYRIIGYDNSTDAINLGRKGVYTLFSNWYDSYLMPNMNYPLAVSVLENHSKEECKKMQKLRRKFHEIMVEIPYNPAYKNINNKNVFTAMKYENPEFVEKFYRLKEGLETQIDLRYGNFMNIGKYKKEGSVVAVFFRNAIYHLCKNNINEVFSYNAPVGKFKDNKSRLMNFLVEGVYKTLDDNGIFVIGNHIKEHLFWADDTTPAENVIRFYETKFYNPRNVRHKENRLRLCYKISPLEQALRENNFEPAGFSFVKFADILTKVPVIWKKLRG